MATAVTPSLPRNAFKWIATTLFAAVIGATIKALWDAPRPLITIATCQIAFDPRSTRLIRIDPLLRQRSATHPYLTTLPEEMTTGELLAYVNGAASDTTSGAALTKTVASMIAFVRSQDQRLSRDDRRRELLHEILTRSGERFLNRAKASAMELQGQLPPKYLQPLPPPLASLSIEFDESIVDLSEIESSEAEALLASSMRDELNREIQSTNLMRRILAYYEADIVIQYMSGVLRYSERIDAEAREIIVGAQALLPLADQRIIVEVLCVNRGVRPIPMLPIGALHIQVPDERGGRGTAVIPVASDTTGVLVISGGEGRVVRFTSKLTVSQIVEANKDLLGSSDGGVDESRLLLLYRARIAEMTAFVTMADCGHDLRKRGEVRSGSAPIATSLEDEFFARQRAR